MMDISMKENIVLKIIKKVIIVSLIIFIATNVIEVFANPSGIDGIDVSSDPNSSYRPTEIINGDFQKTPWMKFTYGGTTYNSYASTRNATLINQHYSLLDYYREQSGLSAESFNNSMMYGNGKIIINGTNGGWNTTEIKLLNGSLFEWIDGYGHLFTSTADNLQIDWNRNYGNGVDNNGNSAESKWKYEHESQAGKILRKGNYFVEMNANNAATLYQDLTTYSGDVIRWTLDHAVREEYGFNKQTMIVEIGAPKTQSGSIVYPLGVNDEINTNIQQNTSSKYYYDGTVTNGTNAQGYSDLNKLKNLRLSRTTQNDGWYKAEGVYIIPENQTTTRFAFISDQPDSDEPAENLSKKSGGNLLDNITFNTLIGNLRAVQNDDGSVVITGYWGETDSNKSLVIKIGDQTYNLTPPNGNFIITVDSEKIGDATSLEVYHTDYEDAKKTVNIIHEYEMTFDSNGGSDVSPQTVVGGTSATKPADPTKEGYNFDGWYLDLVSETPYTFTEPVTGDQTVYAKWTAKEYTVTFDTNGGDPLSQEDATKTVTYDGKYGNLPTPTREGYDFLGWYTDNTYTTKITSDDDVKITDNATLVAKWIVIPGEVTKKDVEDNYMKAEIANENEELVNIIPITEEDEEKLTNGKDLSVFVEVNDIGKTITKANSDIIDKKVKGTEKVGTYFDISIYKQFEGEEKQLIEKTDEKIKISIEIPKDLKGKDGYKIVRINNGEAEEIKATVEGNKLVFETNTSSIYALVYTSAKNPNTSDTICTYVGLFLLSSLSITYVIIYRKKRNA